MEVFSARASVSTGNRGLLYFSPGVFAVAEASIKSLKRALRRSTIERILAFDPASRAEWEARILARVLALPSFQAAESVLLYIKAFAEEIDASPLVEQALGASKRLVCPRVDRGAHRLILHEIRDPRVDLEPGTLGILEPRAGCRLVAPDEVDWVLVPGVVFDVRRNRIGRGGGHYDRFLPTLRDGVETWAAAFDGQVCESLPVEPHDVPLYGIITESRKLQRDEAGGNDQFVNVSS